MFKFLQLKNSFTKDNTETPKIRGSIDLFEDFHILGWVLNDQSSLIKIELFYENELISSCSNNMRRDDVIKAGITENACGFSLNLESIPFVVLAGSEIRCNGVFNQELTESYLKIIEKLSIDDELFFQPSLHELQGNIDEFSGFIIKGWVIAEDKKSDVLVELVLDDEVVGSSVNDIYREDIVNAGMTKESCGFRISLHGVSHEDLYKSEVLCNGVANAPLTEAFHHFVNKIRLENKNESIFDGFIDSFVDSIITGWIILKDDVETIVEIKVIFDDEIIAETTNHLMRQDVIDAGITNKECGFQLDLKGLSLIDLHNSEIHFNGIHHNILSGAFHNLVFEAEKKNRERDSNSPISNIEPKTFHSLEIEASYWQQLSRKLLSSNPEILNSSDKENFYQDMHDDLSLSSIIHQENNIDLNTRKSLFEDKAKALLMRDLDKSKTLLNFERDKYLDLTVILVLYNKAELTYRCLKSLHSLERMPQILVIDNASSDQSQELMSKCKGITYIRNEENVGFLKACNQAREHIDTKYLLLLNNDSVVEYNAIDEALNTFRLQNNLGVVGAKILHLDGLLQEAGSIIWNDGSCIGYGRRKPGYLPQFNFMRDVDFVSGAFFMMPTNLWDKVGGFDEAFYPYYYEEVDLCMRIRSLGYRIVYQPKCVIKHFEYGSSKDFDSALEQMQRNLKVFYDKHKDLLTHHYDASNENIEIAAHRSIKPNLLFIEDQIPYDELGSGFPRSRRILLELKKYYNVFLLPFVPNNFYKDEIDYEDIMIMRAGRLDDINTIANLIPSIEKVWISRPHNIPNFVKSGLHEIALKNSSKIVYDAEAIFSEREKIRCKIFNEKFDSRIEEEEIALLENADIVVSVSDREKELLSKHTTNRIFKVAHPMPSINTDFRNFDNRSDILFIGNLKGTRNESPNVDSIYHFLDKYSKPFIDSGIPIRLIGAIDSKHQKEWESSGAICEGRVDDLQPFFNKALITIAPTRFAAGIPHKVHESLAHGVPVMYTELIGSQVTKDPINEALLKNLSPDFLSKKSNLEILFKKQIQGCSNDMSENDFKNTIKEICGIK